VRGLATLIAAGTAAIACAGCGSSATAPPREQQLQRSDLVAASRALSAAEPSVRSETAASKAAWPLVANGLPANIGGQVRATIRQAAARVAEVHVPELFAERSARSLTGAAAGIAGSFRAYRGLSSRGWNMIEAAIAQIEHGPRGAAAFARANSPLYIESVYDAHYVLAQIGKHLSDGYRKLGGPGAFGQSLTQAEVDALAATYSEAQARLHPHPGVKLGS
jgi:hypothetical protein